MNSFKQGIFAVLALGLLSGSAFADPTPMPFSYRVKVPAGTASCQDHANAIADGFAVSTSMPATGTCQARQPFTDQGKSYSIDVVVVNYVADHEVFPSRSVFGANELMGAGDATAGIFKSYDDCLSQLASQMPIFEAETGLKALDAYCTASTQAEFYPGFSLTIESIGQAKKHLGTFSQDGLGIYAKDDTQTIPAVITALESAGGRIAWSDNTRIFYYAEFGITIANDNLGTFADASQCASQLQDLMTIYTTAGLTGVSTFCRSQGSYGNPAKVDMVVVGAGSDQVIAQESGHYDSFAECRGDLGRLMQNAISSGSHTYGATCSPDEMNETGFIAHLYFGI